MPLPTASSPLSTPSHSELHNEHINVKSFGAEGDNSTDDTTAIQAAVDAARAVGGTAVVYFPAGYYLISSSITLNDTGPAGQGIHFVGAGVSNPDPGSAATRRAQAVIRGAFSGALFTRTSITGEGGFFWENLGLRNTHASGEGIILESVQGSSGVSNCWFQANKGISLIENVFNTQIRNCTFQIGTSGAPTGSWGIYTAGHTSIYGCDVVGFDNGIRACGAGIAISGGRYEANRTAIRLSLNDQGATTSCGRTSIHGISTEANDIGIQMGGGGSGGIHVSGVGIHGSANSPSGAGDVGIKIGEVYASTFSGISESGTHTNGFISQTSGSHYITFESIYSTSAWTLSGSNDGMTVINCDPTQTGLASDNYMQRGLELDAALNHDGTTVGFYGVTPATRPTAYTQTYSTADKTHANFTSADLATTATTQTTPYGFATQAQGDNIATQFNLLRADVADLKQLVNSVIDDLQTLGILQ